MVDEATPPAPVAWTEEQLELAWIAANEEFCRVGQAEKHIPSARIAAARTFVASLNATPGAGEGEGCAEAGG